MKSLIPILALAALLAVCVFPSPCLAQDLGACRPNACGPVQAMPPLPTPHFQPGPHGDFHDGGHGDFHQDFHGGFDPHFQPSPWNWLAPVIVNFATAPRMIVNPATGQAELRMPGQWVLVNAGTPSQTYTWQAMAMWPLEAAKPTPAVALPHPIRTIRGKIRRFISGK
jgi:hypothetical protein